MKYLYLILGLLLSACGGAEEGQDYLVGDDGEMLPLQTELGTAEQAYVVQAGYGIRNDLTGGLGEHERWRPCVQANDSQQCYYPVKRRVQFQLQTDGIALDADRQAVKDIFDIQFALIQEPDNGFNYEKFDQTGCESDEVCTTIRVANVTQPAGTPNNHIRRFLKFTPGTLTNAVGGDKQFKSAICEYDFADMKAYKGGSCTTSGGSACGNGIRHLIGACMALSTGYALTPNATGRANDTNVDGLTGAPATPCNYAQSDAYNPSNPNSKTAFQAECVVQ